MKSEIFISYSRKDYEVVVRLRDEIYHRTGILPWMDMSGIETGAQFADVIARAIDECELLVFVISRYSVKSKWTEREVMYAQDSGKKIYPVVIDDVKVPIHLINIGRMDIRDGVQYEKFLSDLSVFCGARVLSKTPSRNVVSPQFPPRDAERSLSRKILFLLIVVIEIGLFLLLIASLGWLLYVTYWGK